MAYRTNEKGTVADIAIIGGGPGGLTAAIALARRGSRSTVFERDGHPESLPRFNPDRSYPIDLTGHGLRAVRHIDALGHFDTHLTPFHGIRFRSRGGSARAETSRARSCPSRRSGTAT